MFPFIQIFHAALPLLPHTTLSTEASAVPIMVVATRASNVASVVTQAPGTQLTAETKRMAPFHLLACRTPVDLWAAVVAVVVVIAVAVEDIAISGVALNVTDSSTFRL